jgi:DNA invertase Pin-like site-specific DNA recombinase
MTKITPEHLTRGAFVYIRQSTADQLLHNHESRRRQYALAERARQLGWVDVTVVDSDLGRSGAGTEDRPGFEKLLVAICEGRVGAVLSIEASRLSRNGRDWHTLLEFCGLVGCLLIDEDGVYDPRLVNDRLLLGMKGRMSEMELSMLRQRSVEALKSKAGRGELFLSVAVGYVKVGRDRIEKDPDLRVQEAISFVFRKFAEFQSIRQVHLWLRQEQIMLPAVNYCSNNGESAERRLVWKLPVYNTLHHILTNPVYAGAYAFGKTTSRVQLQNGRKRIIRGLKRDRAEWEALIVDHHEEYISWTEFERNQRLIAENAGNKGLMLRRAVNRGDTLLAGLLRCGHCGRKLHVSHSGTKGNVGRYSCQGAHLNHGAERCISFGALRVDQTVGEEVLRVLQPLGIEAALLAIEAKGVESDETRRQVELALQQARFEADRARRQYDAIEPENRLVAAELERRWNERLVEVQRLQERLAALHTPSTPPWDEAERRELLALGADIARAWHHPKATSATRKRILRAVLNEVVARVEGAEIALLLHWHGGDHTAIRVPKYVRGRHRWTTPADTVDMIRALSRLMPDMSIAATLNRAGRRTGRGLTWTEKRVCTFRNDHDIPPYREGERAERGELTLGEAANALATSKMRVLRLIRAGTISARQVCKGAPWIIGSQALIDPAVTAALRLPRRRPVTADPRQNDMVLQ